MLKSAMATKLESVDSKTEPEFETEPMDAGGSSGWLPVGMLAAASAVLGGLAVAWYYRNTLARLRQAEESGSEGDAGANSEGEGI
jgi:hypothetical protein